MQPAPTAGGAERNPEGCKGDGETNRRRRGTGGLQGRRRAKGIEQRAKQ